MKTIHHANGKISEHFQGMGTVTREMVAQRAREIAMINGHLPNHYSREDFLEAKRELTGADGIREEDEEDTLSTLTTWDEEPGTAGHEVQRNEPPDENTIAEALVEQGVNEAEHEQMVEGARYQQNP